jgi:hypothetical protein
VKIAYFMAHPPRPAPDPTLLPAPDRFSQLAIVPKKKAKKAEGLEQFLEDDVE